jgi:TPR repeat protein
MRKRYIFAAVIAIIAAYELVAMPAPTKFQPYLPGITNARSWLETNCRSVGRDIQKCNATIAALEGSGADALNLSSGMAPDDLSGRHYWLHIAAQNGSAEGMRRLAQALAELPDANYGRVHRIRARFWLERAVQAGDAEATNLIPQIRAVSAVEAAAHLISTDANTNPKLICGPMPLWRIFALAWGDFDVRLSLNRSAVLACEDIPRFEENALRGELKWQVSARQLASNISIIQATKLNSSWLPELYWKTVGSENGDPRDMAGLGFILLYEHVQQRPNNPDFRMRGRYWLRRAAAAGDDGYPKQLNKIQNEDLATEWLSDKP